MTEEELNLLHSLLEDYKTLNPGQKLKEAIELVMDAVSVTPAIK